MEFPISSRVEFVACQRSTGWKMDVAFSADRARRLNLASFLNSTLKIIAFKNRH